MPDLSALLTDDELQQFDNVLLNRIDDDAEAEGIDEGILEVTAELDGFLTAIVSVPVLIMLCRVMVNRFKQTMLGCAFLKWE